MKEYKQYTQMEIQLEDSFPKRLKHFRELKGLNMNELAKAIKKHHSLITSYERGKRNPSFDNLIEISDYLNVNPLFLKYGINTDLFEYCKEYIDIYNQCFEAYAKENKLGVFDLKTMNFKQY